MVVVAGEHSRFGGSLVTAGHNAQGVCAVVLGFVVGGESSNGIGRVVVADFEHVVLVRSIWVDGDVFVVLHAVLAFTVEKVGVVEIEAHVHDATHHVLARVALRQSRALLNEVHAGGLAGIFHQGLHLAFELEGGEAGE